MAQLREAAVVPGEREQLEHLLLDAARVVLPLGAAAAISAVGNHGANAGLPRPPPLAAWRVLPVTRASGRPVPSGRIGRRHHGQRRPQALLRPDLELVRQPWFTLWCVLPASFSSLLCWSVRLSLSSLTMIAVVSLLVCPWNCLAFIQCGVNLYRERGHCLTGSFRPLKYHVRQTKRNCTTVCVGANYRQVSCLMFS